MFFNRHSAARAQIVTICRELSERGLIGASEGNVSLRLPSAGGRARFLTTPSGSNKRALRQRDLVLVDGGGAVLQRGAGAPSSELAMHLAIYGTRPDVAAIVHAHPLAAIALTLARLSLARPLLPEAVTLLGGAIHTAPYRPPGTAALAKAVAEALGARGAAALMERHGAVTVGRTLEEARDRMEALERVASVALKLGSLGMDPTTRALSEEEQRALAAKR